MFSYTIQDYVTKISNQIRNIFEGAEEIVARVQRHTNDSLYMKIFMRDVSVFNFYDII